MARTSKDSGAGSELGRLIETTMAAKGLSMRQVSEMSNGHNQRGLSYEHLRKIIKGNTDPSVDMLEKVAKTFGIPSATLLTMQHKATITRKYGSDYLESLDVTPGMYELDSLMKGLLPSQREMVLTQIKALVQGNIASGKTVVIDKPRKKTRRKA